MDIDDEMMLHQLLQEEEDVAADEEEKLLIIACLLRLRSRISAPPRRKDRQRMQGIVILELDYFVDNTIHTPLEFWRHFRMNKYLFMKIAVSVPEYDDYFHCKKECTGLPVFTFVQKCTATLRCIAYGAPPDAVNDYLRMAESTAQHTVNKFYRAIVGKFGSLYLRAQNEQETARILA
jgi:hypothetical protein